MAHRLHQNAFRNLIEKFNGKCRRMVSVYVCVCVYEMVTWHIAIKQPMGHILGAITRRIKIVRFHIYNGKILNWIASKNSSLSLSLSHSLSKGCICFMSFFFLPTENFTVYVSHGMCRRTTRQQYSSIHCLLACLLARLWCMHFILLTYGAIVMRI